MAGRSDVLVCGGGPAGIAAALAAARAGASVQLIEVAGCLGGVWTVGLLTKILDAEGKSGIMAELLQEFASRGSAVAQRSNGTVYDPEVVKRVLEELCVDAGVKIRLHTRLVGAVTDHDKRVVAVLTESKSGREAWLADRFVDCSGDGDLAAHAGCRFDVGIGDACNCQPMSMLALLTGVDPDEIQPYIRETGSVAKRRLLALMEDNGVTPSYRAPTLRHLHSGIYSIMTNHEYGVSAFDADAITQATIHARREIHEIVDGLRNLGDPWHNLSIVATAEQIGVREGRRIRGRYTVTAEDLANGLRHEQAVCRARFSIDVHALDSLGNKEVNRQFKKGGIEALRYSLSCSDRRRRRRTVDGGTLYQRRLYRAFQLSRYRKRRASGRSRWPGSCCFGKPKRYAARTGLERNQFRVTMFRIQALSHHMDSCPAVMFRLRTVRV